MTETEAKIQIGKILISEFDRLADELRETTEDLMPIIRRANLVRVRMAQFSIKNGEPPEMIEQINILDSIIKKLEHKHNKYVADM